MKTTVKNFILDNMTDSNFEKLVNFLIIVEIFDNDLFESELSDKITEYISDQNASYTENNTFEKLHSIEKRTDDSNRIRNDEFSNQELPMDTPLDMIIDESEDIDNDKVDSIDFELEIEPNDVTFSNYQEYVNQKQSILAFKLSHFILGILNYKSDEKLKNNFEQFSNEKSHVKIDDENEHYDGYCVHFLLDNRTRYLSEGVLTEYYNTNRFRVISDDPGYNTYADFEFKVTPIEFVEYELLQEVLIDDYIYILAPFTDYLNEELIVPKLSKEGLYNILQQFIHLFTIQGFTREEQINNIKYFDENYENWFKDINML